MNNQRTFPEAKQLSQACNCFNLVASAIVFKVGVLFCCLFYCSSRRVASQSRGILFLCPIQCQLGVAPMLL